LVSSPKVRSWQTLLRTQQKVYTHLSNLLAKKDFSIARFRVLFNLYFEGPHTPVQISRKLNVSRANTMSLLNRLKDDAYIKTSKKDGSVKRPAYVLSAKGKRYFEKILPEHLSNVDDVFKAFPKKMLDLLNEIHDNTPNKGS